jgi:serine/threonine-protein kinase RsbW
METRAPSFSGAQRVRFDCVFESPLDGALRIAWLEAVEALAVRILEASGLDGGSPADFGLAVREAVMNGLRHGAEPVGGRVAVTFRLVQGSVLAVTVRDPGAGFDPAALPDPCAPENLCRGSGRGVFYMKQFADEVRFAFPRRGGTVTRLLKRLPGRPEKNFIFSRTSRRSQPTGADRPTSLRRSG